MFPPLLADPREVQTYLSYYRHDGQDDADVALGRAWGLTRWRTGILQEWLWELDIEGMAYSRFQLGGGINQFQTVDFFGNLPVTVRYRDLSFKAMIFHESAHLGDDYIRDTGNEGVRYSVEGLRALVAYEPALWMRLYAGATDLIHTVPDQAHWTAQGGLELSSGDLGWSRRVPTRLYVAEDVQSHQYARWNVNSNTVAGVKVGFRESPRDVRFQLGYFTGRSPFGQFYRQKDHYADVALILEF